MSAIPRRYKAPLIDRLDTALFSHSFTLFGCRVHTYPIRCAMHGALEIQTKRWGWVCFRPPVRSFGRWLRPYLYCSPDATPYSATYRIGGPVEP